MIRALRWNTTGLGLALAVALLAPRAELRSATVAHEGFSSPVRVDAILTRAGHAPVAMTRAQVEAGELMVNGAEIFVISRRSTLSGASLAYVQAVGNFVANGGDIVAEYSGASMFFSSYAAPMVTMSNRTPQLGTFIGAFRSGHAYLTATPIYLADPAHEVVAGLANPFSEAGGTDNFFWMQSTDPDLQVIGFFNGNGTAPFPAGMLPCLAVGCKGNSKFVFATWDWNDTLHFDGSNVRMFVNAVNFAAVPCNKAPACDAGGPYLAECGGAATTIALDGTRSTDPDGDALAYHWTSDCPGFTFDDPTSPTPMLSVDATSACAMQCTVTLTVSDGRERVSCSSMVTVQDLMPPEIAAHVAPHGSGQWERMVSFAAADACGMASASAHLETGCSQIPVAHGQVIDMSGAEFWCNPMSRDPQTFVLVVTAVDDCGNAATTTFEWSEIAPEPPKTFVRGDCNGDGPVDHRDMFHLMFYLFRRGAAPHCMDAADANDDGSVDIRDVIALVYSIYRCGFHLPSPHPEAGVDPTEDGLDCGVYPSPGGSYTLSLWGRHGSARGR